MQGSVNAGWLAQHSAVSSAEKCLSIACTFATEARAYLVKTNYFRQGRMISHTVRHDSPLSSIGDNGRYITLSVRNKLVSMKQESVFSSR